MTKHDVAILGPVTWVEWRGHGACSVCPAVCEAPVFVNASPAGWLVLPAFHLEPRLTCTCLVLVGGSQGQCGTRGCLVLPFPWPHIFSL